MDQDQAQDGDFFGVSYSFARGECILTIWHMKCVSHGLLYLSEVVVVIFSIVGSYHFCFSHESIVIFSFICYFFDYRKKCHFRRQTVVSLYVVQRMYVGVLIYYSIIIVSSGGRQCHFV